ncbi:hypothetical protein RYX36_007752 [Vicia faba]
MLAINFSPSFHGSKSFSRTYCQKSKEKSNSVPTGARVDADGPLIDTGDTSIQTDASAEAGSQTLNQLTLPAPSTTSNGVAPPVKVDPKWDLLSGEKFNSPKVDNSLALVPVGEQQAASPTSQQNALVLLICFLMETMCQFLLIPSKLTFSPSKQFLTDFNKIS